MDDPAFRPVEHAEGKRQSVFANMLGCKPCHRVEFRFAAAAKAFGIANNPVLAFKLTAVNLKKDRFKRVEHFSVFTQEIMRVFAA